MVGDTTATQYFDVHPSTGGIYVKRDLRTTSIAQFRIEVRAVDGGGRTSIANSFRVINVRRNNFAPRFADGSCDLTVSATGVGTVVTVDASDADIGELLDYYEDLNISLQADHKIVGVTSLCTYYGFVSKQ